MKKAINVKVGTAIYNHIKRVVAIYEEPRLRWDGIPYIIDDIKPSELAGHVKVFLRT